MSNDEIFFREVNEEIRQDKTRAIWSRYGRLFIALLVFAVLATAAYVAWREYDASLASASGDRYLAALDLASKGELDQALTELQSLEADGYGAYKDLARMRVATVREAQGDAAAAVAAFDAVTADVNAPQPIRDIAAVRAAYILVDTGSLDDVSRRVVQLSGDDQPLRYPAREALGLAAWKAGDLDAAKRYFEQLGNDGGAPSGIGLRTKLMLDLIAAGSRPVVTGAPGAPAPASPALPAPMDAPGALLPAPTTPTLDAPGTGGPTDLAPTLDAAPPAAAPASEAVPSSPAAPSPTEPAPVQPAAPAAPEAPAPALEPAPAGEAPPASGSPAAPAD